MERFELIKDSIKKVLPDLKYSLVQSDWSSNSTLYLIPEDRYFSISLEEMIAMSKLLPSEKLSVTIYDVEEVYPNSSCLNFRKIRK